MSKTPLTDAEAKSYTQHGLIVSADFCRAMEEKLAVAQIDLRDQFAGKALISIDHKEVAKANPNADMPTVLATMAYQLADAMLVARKEKL